MSRWPASLTPKCSGAEPFSLCSFTLSLSFRLLPKSEGWREMNMCHNSEQSGKICSVCLCVCVREQKVLWLWTRAVWYCKGLNNWERTLFWNAIVCRWVSGSEIESIGSTGKCEGVKSGRQHLWHQRWDFVIEVVLMQTQLHLVCAFRGLVWPEPWWRRETQNCHILFILQKCPGLHEC